MSRRHRHKSNQRVPATTAEWPHLLRVVDDAEDAATTFERGVMELERITSRHGSPQDDPLQDDSDIQFDGESGVPRIDLPRLSAAPPSLIAAHSTPRIDTRPAVTAVTSGQIVVLIIVITVAAVAGFWWPQQTVRWAVDLKIPGDADAAMPALRATQDTMSDPRVMRDASRRLNQPVGYMDQLVMQDRIRVERRTADSTVRYSVTAPARMPDEGSAILQAWIDACQAQRRADATAAEQTMADLRGNRVLAEQSLNDARTALEKAQRVLDDDPVESSLRRLRATAMELHARYETARREADSARLIFNREENMTEDDVTRTVDAARMAEAEASDDVLASDMQELVANAVLLQSEWSSLEAIGEAALTRLAEAAFAGRKELASVIAAADLADPGELPERLGRAFHELETTATEFLSDWRSGMGALRGWNTDSAAGALLMRQKALHDGLVALIARSGAALERMDNAVDDMQRVGDETARRSVLRSRIARLVMPARVAVEDLDTCLDGLDTTNDAELDGIRRSVMLLAERAERRRLDVREAMKERLRQEWREGRQVQIASARQALDDAVARREAIASQRDAAQTALHDALQQTPRLDGRRHEVALREAELKAASAALADIESRLADAQRSRRDAANADWQASQIVELPQDRQARIMRAAASAGMAGMSTMLLLSLVAGWRGRRGAGASQSPNRA